MAFQIGAGFAYKGGDPVNLRYLVLCTFGIGLMAFLLTDTGGWAQTSLAAPLTVITGYEGYVLRKPLTEFATADLGDETNENRPDIRAFLSNVSMPLNNREYQAGRRLTFLHDRLGEILFTWVIFFMPDPHEFLENAEWLRKKVIATYDRALVVMDQPLTWTDIVNRTERPTLILKDAQHNYLRIDVSSRLAIMLRHATEEMGGR